ncbi:bifunctional demethylmenaquinone methyltransferase/2-methoxy-6-polyprenyl-1,4-benzoquinol methylase UbiE [Methylocystis sp. SB2]|uniref:bifunctional demethylmenaquinone methyltransferase/2-methoxy-6-polyprenyl-1,4-benzoquinol methylase UbiE n=1 Tax=Methylocystis sp. (strain SB2) TaxID=743836 RepID=UPI00187276F7|nr:bifunctional demethylmenaquinone methyltransferase/2-methoxy-6-polyprenyl-1,4-benzoquinol methylase UbiE [Methylocystis sp. SB2]ULO25507.1 bifunctional demethylmenaquinone methyltransferase/2-methoxy-6-polyprenyl-1,4-benzoquinol methylase UbiE [Methylocystis sp. SB2]
MMIDRTSEREGSTHFGYSEVPLNEKQGLVDDVFHKVARRYDIMNDLMSGGMHRLWKDTLVAKVNARGRKDFRHLDVAGGTGDVAFRISTSAAHDAEIVVLDINGDMLEVGRDRARERGVSGVEFVQANAESLPFPDAHFDSYTVAFGIRNVPRIDVALAEAYRVLKPGGRFLCLEFSQVAVPGLDKLYEAYSFNVIPAIGKLVAGDSEPYRYLVESIRKFPSAEEFERMIRKAGFRRTGFERLTGGVVAIHSGWKS